MTIIHWNTTAIFSHNYSLTLMFETKPIGEEASLWFSPILKDLGKSNK